MLGNNNCELTFVIVLRTLRLVHHVAREEVPEVQTNLKQLVLINVGKLDHELKRFLDALLEVQDVLVGFHCVSSSLDKVNVVLDKGRNGERDLFCHVFKATLVFGVNNLLILLI